MRQQTPWRDVQKHSTLVVCHGKPQLKAQAVWKRIDLGSNRPDKKKNIEAARREIEDAKMSPAFRLGLERLRFFLSPRRTFGRCSVESCPIFQSAKLIFALHFFLSQDEDASMSIRYLGLPKQPTQIHYSGCKDASCKKIISHKKRETGWGGTGTTSTRGLTFKQLRKPMFCFLMQYHFLLCLPFVANRQSPLWNLIWISPSFLVFTVTELFCFCRELRSHRPLPATGKVWSQHKPAELKSSVCLSSAREISNHSNSRSEYASSAIQKLKGFAIGP